MYREHFGFDLRAVDASDRFLKRLRGEEEPERKRKIIGATFIEVFEQEARSIPDVKFLAQGTLYPDVIESVSFKGPSATIKSHHNVGGLPERMHLSLIEPLRELFKDEVRKVGGVLGIPEAILHRQPFPGPGLAIRVLGEVTAERLAVLREADAIVREEIAGSPIAASIWQWFAVLLPVKTVGVMGDERTYDNVIAVRAVESLDGMTADWARLPARPAGAHVEPDHQRGPRRESGDVRHLVEAAGHDRMGMRRTAAGYRRPATGTAQLGLWRKPEAGSR